MTRSRILVIDDDPLFRSLLTSMLRKAFLVTAASDGAEGYYMALERPPHLAIVDIKMPGWDGLRTLKAFRSHHLLSRIPVMMLTSDSSRQTVMAALQAGASDYVIKTTLSRDDFIRKVCRQLNVEPDIFDEDDEVVEINAGEAVGIPSSRPLRDHPIEPLIVVNPGIGGVDRIRDDDGALQALIQDWE
jgi:DNA-binding response OmpR family regulator